MYCNAFNVPAKLPYPGILAASDFKVGAQVSVNPPTGFLDKYCYF